MFTGELVAVPSAQAECGSEATAAAYEFKIIMFSDNSYDQQEIAIVIKCPKNLGANFFKVGAKYKMEVFDSAGDTDYSIINQDVLANYGLTDPYWAGDIKRVK